MTLAKELLEHGETEIVLQYLEICKKFWRILMRALRLFPIRKWKRKIRQGEVPEFGAHLLY